MVDIEFVECFSDTVSLATIKETLGLEEMIVIRKGVRLSVQPATKNEFNIIRKLGRRKICPKEIKTSYITSIIWNDKSFASANW